MKQHEILGILNFGVFTQPVKISKRTRSGEGRTESVKMVKQVTMYASCEVCGVIRFLHTLGRTNTEVREEFKSVYGEKCMSLVMVGKWVKQFDAGQTDVHDKKWITPRTSHDTYVVTCFSIFTDSILPSL